MKIYFIARNPKAGFITIVYVFSSFLDGKIVGARLSADFSVRRSEQEYSFYNDTMGRISPFPQWTVSLNTITNGVHHNNFTQLT